MALNDLTNQNIQDTYQKVVQTDGVNIADGTGSALPIKFDGPDLIVSGALRAQSYIVSESVVNVSSGSTVFGDSADDSHTFNGNITASGNISASGTSHIFGGDLTVKDDLIVSDNVVIVGSLIDVTHVTASGTVKADIIQAAESYIISSATVIDITGTGLSTTLEIGETSAPNAIFKGHSTFLTAVSDIYLDAAGGQIYMRDDSTTYFTFNVDATPEIDIVGNLNIDPSGGNVKFSDSNINVEGHITASDNISASGDVYADDYYCNNNLMMGYDIASGTQLFGESTSKTFLSATNIKLDAPITASGTISASGMIQTAGAISSSTGITASAALFSGNITGSGTLKVAGNIHANGNIIGDDTTDITNISNINCDTINDDATQGDTNIALTGTTLNIEVGGETFLESQGDRLKFRTNITASGAISSSGKITANSMDTATMEATRYSGGHRTLQYDAQTQVGSKAQGDIFLHHTSVSTTAGRIYKMQTNGNLTAADKDEEMSGHSVLCVAIGTDSQADGMLLRGMVKLETDPCPGTTAQVGAPVYLGDSGASTGSIESHASDDYIRILGHYMSGSGVIYFNPDSTFIKKA